MTWSIRYTEEITNTAHTIKGLKNLEEARKAAVKVIDSGIKTRTLYIPIYNDKGKDAYHVFQHNGRYFWATKGRSEEITKAGKIVGGKSTIRAEPKPGEIPPIISKKSYGPNSVRYVYEDMRDPVDVEYHEKAAPEVGFNVPFIAVDGEYWVLYLDARTLGFLKAMEFRYGSQYTYRAGRKADFVKDYPFEYKLSLDAVRTFKRDRKVVLGRRA